MHTRARALSSQTSQTSQTEAQAPDFAVLPPDP